MKHLPLFIWLCLSLINFSSLQAQMFGGPAAKWIYGISNISTTGYIETNLIGTTILNNQTVQTYRSTVHEYSLVTRDTQIFQRPNEFMYEENGVLFYYNQQIENFDTLIWFAGIPGDMWEIQSPIDSSEIFTTEIIDTGSLIINSNTLRFLAVSYNGGITDTLVEDIGSISSSIKPWEKLISESPIFRCYSDDNLGLYQKDPSTDCEVINAPIEERLFGGPNAKWTYDRFRFSARGYTEISVLGDTVINGITCQIYSKINTEKNCSLNVVQINELPPDYMYEEEEVLYIYNPDMEVFDTLLWFGASSGDSWELTSPGSEFFDTLSYVVTDTGQLFLNDMPLPFLEVEITSAQYGDNFIYSDTIVPGIGTLNHFYKSWQIFDAQVDGDHDGYSFRCYEDDQIGFFQKDPDIPCDFIHDSAPYGGPGAVWTYNRQLGPFQGYLEVTNVGDTTINDFHLHILQKTAVMQMGENVVYDTLSPTYIHIDHEGVDVIYYFDTSDQSVDTLIWYGANVGDSWELVGPRDFTNRYEVIGTGEIDIEGYTKTYQAVNIYTNDLLSYQDTIVYGIGPIYYSYLPWDNFHSSIFIPFDAQEFRCYRDDIIGLYQKDPDIPCDFISSSEAYGGPNAVWTYARNLGSISGYLEVSRLGDTIINNIDLQILGKVAVSQFDQGISFDTLPHTYININIIDGGDVVSYFDTSDQTIDTLFWYGANVGDSWELVGPRDFTNRYEVIGTGEIDIEGHTKTYQAVNIYTNDAFSYQDTIVHGIGPISKSFLPWDFLFNTLAAPFDAQEFRCYRDDIIGLYQKDPDVDCDLLVNSLQYRPNWDVGFYPNPVRQTLYLDIPESAGEVQFTIASPTGAILDQGIFREAPTIDMGRYPTGLYHIRLISKDKVGLLKVIKSD